MIVITGEEEIKLKPDIRYIVTKGNDTLAKNEIVSIVNYGDLHSYSARRLIKKEDIPSAIKGASFKVDIDHYRRLKKEAIKQLAKINAIFDECEKEEK